MKKTIAEEEAQLVAEQFSSIENQFVADLAQLNEEWNAKVNLIKTELDRNLAELKESQETAFYTLMNQAEVEFDKTFKQSKLYLELKNQKEQSSKLNKFVEAKYAKEMMLKEEKNNRQRFNQRKLEHLIVIKKNIEDEQKNQQEKMQEKFRLIFELQKREREYEEEEFIGKKVGEKEKKSAGSCKRVEVESEVGGEK